MNIQKIILKNWIKVNWNVNIGVRSYIMITLKNKSQSIILYLLDKSLYFKIYFTKLKTNDFIIFRSFIFQNVKMQDLTPITFSYPDCVFCLNAQPV